MVKRYNKPEVISHFAMKDVKRETAYMLRGVDYNVHVLFAILEHVAPGLGWRQEDI